jgi:hypothetical protein
MFLATETAQEVAQESTNIVASELAISLNNALEDTDIEHATRQEILDRIVETAKTSALAFGAMGLPGATVTPTAQIAQQHAKKASTESIEDTVNGMFPGHNIKYKKVKEGFEFQVTDPESDLNGATFVTDSLYANEIKAKLEEVAQGRKDLEPENIQAGREKAEGVAQSPDIQEEVNQIKDKDLIKTSESYEIAKDIWIGKKDFRLLEAQVEKRKFQDQLIELYGETPKSRKVAKTLGLTGKTKIMGERAKKIDMAIHLYIDTKRNPEHLELYRDDLTAGQKELVDLSQNLPADVMPLVQQIEASYEKIGKEARGIDVIQNLLDNYAARMWDVGQNPTREMAKKFGAKTRHRHRRKYDTIIEGWAVSNREHKEGKRDKPLKLKIKGATNNLHVLKDELVKTIADKKFLENLKTLYDENGEKLIYTESKAPDDYVKLDHPNLNTWKRSNQVDLATYDKPLSGRNYFIDGNGVVFERQQLYAQPEIAKNLNKILGISRLANTPGVRTVTKYNAIFKQWLLLTSLFHHLAFMRSFYLPSGIKDRGMTPRQAYKDGMKSIMALEPEIKLLVENGLTLGLQQEWDEHLAEEQTVIGKMIDKIPGGEGVKQKILDLRKLQTDFLFGQFGAGLKAKVALIELREHMAKNPTLDTKEAARQVAEMTNNDFGGLHLQRLGRDPTVQHLFRLFALAPDWTESNVRTIINLVKSKGKDGDQSTAERELYRRFWVGVLWKGFAATALANFALAGGDVGEMERRFKRAWKEGKFRWLMIDITPIYKAFGGTSPERKYFSFIGHFQDPIKFIAHPAISVKHKGSVVSRIAVESWTGSDWANRRFTTLGELMTKGETVTWGKGKGLEWDQFPSFTLHQLRAVQPIQLQQFMGWMSGETDGFDALTNSLGLGVRTTYSRKKKTKF